MGRRRGKETSLLAVPPPSKPGSVRGGRDSDTSDAESLAYSSVAGDCGASMVDEDLSELDQLVESFAEQIDDAQDKK